jgi:hypothetical protein
MRKDVLRIASFARSGVRSKPLREVEKSIGWDAQSIQVEVRFFLTL